MTENRGNVFISRCPWWFPKSLIPIETECWGRGVRWGPGHAIPHLQDHNHRHYEVLLSCLLVNRPSHWLLSVTQGLWLASTRHQLESLGHRVSLLLSAQYFLTIITSSIETFLRAPGHVPLRSPSSPVFCVDFITEFLQIDLRPGRICNLVNSLQLVFITCKYETWNESPPARKLH